MRRQRTVRTSDDPSSPSWHGSPRYDTRSPRSINSEGTFERSSIASSIIGHDDPTLVHANFKGNSSGKHDEVIKNSHSEALDSFLTVSFSEEENRDSLDTQRGDESSSDDRLRQQLVELDQRQEAWRAQQEERSKDMDEAGDFYLKEVGELSVLSPKKKKSFALLKETIYEEEESRENDIRDVEAHTSSDPEAEGPTNTTNNEASSEKKSNVRLKMVPRERKGNEEGYIGPRSPANHVRPLEPEEVDEIPATVEAQRDHSRVDAVEPIESEKEQYQPEESCETTSGRKPEGEGLGTALRVVSFGLSFDGSDLDFDDFPGAGKEISKITDTEYMVDHADLENSDRHRDRGFVDVEDNVVIANVSTNAENKDTNEIIRAVQERLFDFSSTKRTEASISTESFNSDDHTPNSRLRSLLPVGNSSHSRAEPKRSMWGSPQHSLASKVDRSKDEDDVDDNSVLRGKRRKFKLLFLNSCLALVIIAVIACSILFAVEFGGSRSGEPSLEPGNNGYSNENDGHSTISIEKDGEKTTETDVSSDESTENDISSHGSIENDFSTHESTINDGSSNESIKNDESSNEWIENDESSNEWIENENESIGNDESPNELNENNESSTESTENDEHPNKSIENNEPSTESTEYDETPNESIKNNESSTESTENDETTNESIKTNESSTESTENDGSSNGSFGSDGSSDESTGNDGSSNESIEGESKGVIGETVIVESPTDDNVPKNSPSSPETDKGSSIQTQAPFDSWNTPISSRITTPESSSPSEAPSPGETPEKDQILTEAPTLDPKSVEGRLRAISGESINDITSPQHKASNWLTSEDPANLNLDRLSDEDLSQRYIAALLFFSLDGWNWFEQYDFLTESHVCEWNNGSSRNRLGIICNGSDKIIGFAINDNNLRGQLPEELTKLTEMTLLQFRTNHIDGTLPSGFDKLSKLEEIDIRQNELVGSVPEEIFNLPDIKRILLLRNSQLSGTIPATIDKASNLEMLSFQKCHFTGSIPNTIGNLSNLFFFTFMENLLTGLIPESVTNLSSLEVLELSGNQLTGSIPDLMRHDKLYFLSLFDNKLRGTIPNSLGGLPKLMFLDIRTNQLDGSIPPSIGGLTDLVTFFAQENKLTGTIPSFSGNNGLLQAVHLSDNALTGNLDAFFEASGPKERLITVDLSRNNLTGSLPASVGFYESLSDLSLEGNLLTGTIPQAIVFLKELDTLILGENNFSGTLPEELGFLNQLLSLNVANNRLEGTIPDTLSLLLKLKALDIHSNQFIGSLPTALSQLTNLDELYLNNNALTGDLTETFCRGFPFGIIESFAADCLEPSPEVTCECCTSCCKDDNCLAA